MELNRKAEEALQRFFTIGHIITDIRNNRTFYFEDSGSLLKYEIVKKNAEIPLMCVNTAVERYNREFYNTDIIKMYTPLISTTKIKFYRTPSMLFSNLVYFCTRDYNLMKAVSTNGEVYYGAQGTILDKNKKPLILCTVNVNLEGRFRELTKLNMYINPSVFTSNGILEKFIISKIIPRIISGKIRLHESRFGSGNLRNITGVDDRGWPKKFIPEIIISEDINKFFNAPEEVYNIENISTSLKNEFDDFFAFLDHK